MMKQEEEFDKIMNTENEEENEKKYVQAQIKHI